MPKGHTNNPNGRPKGAKSAKTIQWEELGESIITTHAQRFNDILHETDDTKFTALFVQVLEHFKPKLSRSEQKVEGSNELIVKVIRK